MKILTEDKIKDMIYGTIRLVSYGIVASVGWKLTYGMAEKEEARLAEVSKLKVELMENKNDILRDQITKLQDK